MQLKHGPDGGEISHEAAVPLKNLFVRLNAKNISGLLPCRGLTIERLMKCPGSATALSCILVYRLDWGWNVVHAFALSGWSGNVICNTWWIEIDTYTTVHHYLYGAWTRNNSAYLRVICSNVQISFSKTSHDSGIIISNIHRYFCFTFDDTMNFHFVKCYIYCVYWIGLKVCVMLNFWTIISMLEGWKLYW